MTVAYGEEDQCAALIPAQSMDENIARRNVGDSCCIMDAVVSVSRV